jgi:hypothetical protein
MSKKFDVNAIVSERKNELDSSPLFQSKPEPAKPVNPDYSPAFDAPRGLVAAAAAEALAPPGFRQPS